MATNRPGGDAQTNIGVFATQCAQFEVRLKPEADLQSTLTNIQFAIKWPEGIVELIDFESPVGLQQQGPVYQSEGYNYAVFIAVPAQEVDIDWSAGNEYPVLYFAHDQSGDAPIDITIASDDWAQGNNAQFYFELLGIDNTGSVYHQAENVYTGSCIDIGLFSPECAQFEVRLRANASLTANITNVQFAVKWPENTVDILHVESGFGIEQQGPTYVHDGYNYAVFVGVPVDDTILEWEEGQEHTVLAFEHDQSGDGLADFLIAEDAWAADNNSLFYIEDLGVNVTGQIYHQAIDTYIGSCRNVSLRVFLQGPFDGEAGSMHTDINDAGNIPASQPYHNEPWQYNGDEQVDDMPANIVDWVLVELRDASAPGTLVERRAGLLTSDGDVLDTDLEEGLFFTTSTGSYYLVVLHRNHIPVMSGEPITIPNIDNPYDFTEITLTTPYKHLDPVPAVVEMPSPGGSVYGMIAGDATSNGSLKYIGPDNDRDFILFTLTSVTGDTALNLIVEGYYNADLDMDNRVIYIGPGEDRGLLLMNIITLMGTEDVNAVYETVVPPLDNP